MKFLINSFKFLYYLSLYTLSSCFFLLPLFHPLQHPITCLLRNNKVGCTPCHSEALAPFCHSEALAEEPPPLSPKRECLAIARHDKAGQRRFATSSKIQQPLPFIHTQYSPNRSLLLQILCQRNYMNYFL